MCPVLSSALCTTRYTPRSPRRTFVNADELVGLLSHFDMSWHTLRQNLVY